MTGTGNSVAVRPNGTAATQQPGAALELRSGQTMWTRDQHAALVAMGIPKEATSAELGVFLHQCQRTGLDPFSKQIYLIYRPGYENGRPVSKPTTQVGIDGFRVIRDRIARRDGLRVEYADTLWYAADGQPTDVWLWDEPPAACKFTVLVDGRRFPSTLRFGEYAQRKKDGTVNKMWTEKPAHMIEKCAEADALRRAFPHDMAGVILEDAAPLAEDEPVQRPRVTAEQARQRVTATVETVTQEPSPAAPEPPVSGPAVTPTPAEVAAAGEAPTQDDVRAKLGALGVHDLGPQLKMAARLTGRRYRYGTDLERDGSLILSMVRNCETAEDLDGLLADLEMASDPRGGTDE